MSLLDIKIITNKYIMEEQPSQSGDNISEELGKTLDNYRTVLQQCTETMKNNTNINKEKIV